MRVAAIDCGTNSIRLLIADINEGQFQEIDRRMEIVRLGQGVDKNKAFDPAAIERTLRVTEEYAQIIATHGVERVRFCATSATRDATNRDLFILGVKNILGIEPEVIPGVEEATLSFIGATKELPAQDAPFLVVDIGGGSTEFVLGTGSVESAKSVNIGCVRMAERHLNQLPPTDAIIIAATADIDSAIALAAKDVAITTSKSLVCVAGTATTVAAAALSLTTYDRDAIHLARISATKVHEVAAMFQVMGRDAISALGYMHPGRVDVITAGSLVLSRVLHATDAKEFIACESDILDGIAWNLADGAR